MTLKTEREKMLAGELYMAADPELTEMRIRARRLTHRFNTSTEEELGEQQTILRELFGMCLLPCRKCRKPTLSK